MYKLDRVNKIGKSGSYYIASRKERIDELRLNTGITKPDSVIIFSVMDDKVVLTRQFRYAVNGYTYEFPAGLIDDGESAEDAAVREMKEETGLELRLIKAAEIYTKPYFPTVGLTDEACSMVYGYASGTVTDKFQEENEEIEVIFADKAMVRQILEAGEAVVMCAYRLMNFLSDEKPFAFLNGAGKP